MRNIFLQYRSSFVKKMYNYTDGQYPFSNIPRKKKHYVSGRATKNKKKKKTKTKKKQSKTTLSKEQKID